ncbi:hypothetical protein M378DRAFT_160191, partial [Amanita muscaria Koide BX008]
MAKTPIEVLKKGLSILQQQVKARKAQLEAKLRRNEKISHADEEWLDGKGNLVDEERVVEVLETASDYEMGLQRLNDAEKDTIQRLRELAVLILFWQLKLFQAL